MSYKENLKLAGRLNIVVKDSSGNIKEARQVDNLVVQAGLRWITESMAKTSNTPAAMTHMGIGDGNVAAADADTDLGGTNKFRKAFTTPTVANSSPSVGTGNIVYVTQFDTGDRLPNHATNSNNSAITEAGIFNASTAGTMLCRTVFPVVNKGDNDTMTITWTITLDAV
jgi:hypothetical protein